MPSSSGKVCSRLRAVTCAECRRNHAVESASVRFDGCRVFVRSIRPDGTKIPECASCGCHKSFHPKEVQIIPEAQAQSQNQCRCRRAAATATTMVANRGLPPLPPQQPRQPPHRPAHPSPSPSPPPQRSPPPSPPPPPAQQLPVPPLVEPENEQREIEEMEKPVKKRKRYLKAGQDASNPKASTGG